MPLYQIADLLVQMDPKYPTLTGRAAQYLTERTDAPDFIIKPAPGYIAQMQESAPHLTPDQCEYIRFGTLFYMYLLRHEGMMLHASAVVVDGRAYLFSASSGTGKSTHTSAWLELFGSRAYILNDDKPALRFRDGVLCACGTPFSGKDDISRNVSVPVAGICMLGRGEENQIAPLPVNEALPLLYEQTQRYLLPKDGARMLELLTRVVTAVPLWRLRCTIGTDAARVAYEAMKQ